MKIYKEAEIINPIYITTLDNGVTLFVFDGYAAGSDGKTYHHVGKEVDGDMVTVGWRCEE